MRRWKIEWNKWRILLSLLLSVCGLRLAIAQEPLDVESHRDTIALPSLSYEMLVGADTLMWPDTAQVWLRFFAELEALRAGKDTVVTIVQLGDSHIQAGSLSGQVMRAFHHAFGNAGRGWIAPFKLGKSNEPDDYFIKSVVKDWVCGRCIQRERKTPIGIGGIGIRSYSPSINWDVIITPINGAGYAFNKAILYRGDRSMPASSFKNLYYGLSLTNGAPGVLYHSIGVNGAMYVHYSDSAYVRQLALLKPSLLILSLGTNETFGRSFRSEEFAGQVRSFLNLVKHYLPNTAILLTTPPECYKRIWVNKKRQFARNTHTEQAAAALCKVAKEEGVACWDLFRATGGKQSCKRWLNKHLLGRDRVHFTREGYREQGTMLFRALMQTYNHLHIEYADNYDID